MSGLALFFATMGPTGYIRFAPGTFGSAIGVGFYLLLHFLRFDMIMQIVVAVLLVGASIWAASAASRHFQQEDPSQVVVDEVAGQFVTLMLTGSAIRGAILGFLVFRVLDIIKPWPAQKIERLHGGVGIVGDDVAVAIYGNLILQGVFYFVPDFR
jgi:phosphatidylglycerophosphatase A